jgi:hypothetical protein
MHFPETSIENLRGFGYTEDEARFGGETQQAEEK